MDLLQGISKYIDDNKFRVLLDDMSQQDIRNKNSLEPCSKEYLDKALETPLDYGYPQTSYGIGVKEFIKDTETTLQKDLMFKMQQIQSFLGASKNALSMYYPKDGYIGWHHNGNAPGYNILFTYNTTNDGAFYHYDLKEKQIITMSDEKGWNVKAGRYPDQKTEQDNLFWHCAKTNSPRFTIAFVIDNLIMWEDMIAEIQEC